jgi:hypothetical protein
LVLGLSEDLREYFGAVQADTKRRVDDVSSQGDHITVRTCHRSGQRFGFVKLPDRRGADSQTGRRQKVSPGEVPWIAHIRSFVMGACTSRQYNLSWDRLQQAAGGYFSGGDGSRRIKR